MNRREKRRAKRRARLDALDECFDLCMTAIAYTGLTYAGFITNVGLIHRCSICFGKLLGILWCILTVTPLVGFTVHYWRKLRKEMKRILSKHQN